MKSDAKLRVELLNRRTTLSSQPCIRFLEFDSMETSKLSFQKDRSQ